MQPYENNDVTTRAVSDRDAEICINAWYYVDDSGFIMRIAAKAYALCGDDQDKLAELKSLSAVDHLTATQALVPQKFTASLGDQKLQGCIHHSMLSMDPMPVFDDLFSEIENSLPLLMRTVNDSFESFKTELKEPFIWCLTGVHEQNDGQLVAQIS